MGLRKLAAAIIEYRKEHEGFRTIDELANVRGIGLNMIDQNIERLTLSQPQRNDPRGLMLPGPLRPRYFLLTLAPVYFSFNIGKRGDEAIALLLFTCIII